jgi:hypothetical protein
VKRIFMVLGLAIGLAVPVYAASIAVAAPATAVVCTDWTSYYAIKDKVEHRQPTSVYSNWVWPRYGSFTITYNETKSYTNTASVTATVSVKEGVIFASASESIGVTVGASWSQSKSWSYAATVAKDAYHEYRVHLYHKAWSFKVMKVWSRVCDGQVYRHNAWSSWQSVYHAPVKSGSANVWQVDRRSA